MLNKKAILRVVVAIVAIYVVFDFVYDVIRVNYQAVKTNLVMEKTVADTIDMDVFIVREEDYIKNSSIGINVSVAQDAAMVANGDNVSLVFSSEQDAVNYMKYSKLVNSLERYESIRKNQNYNELDVSSVDNEIDTLIFKYLNTAETGNVLNINEVGVTVRDKLVSKNILINGEMKLDDIIAETKSEIKKLSSSAKNCTKIKTNDSGYYVGASDGYEKTIDITKLSDLKVKDVENALNSKPAKIPDDVMGKLVTGFNWHIVAVIDTKSANKITEKGTYKIQFPYTATDEVTAVVESIQAKEKDKCVIIMKCNLMDESIINMRKESAKLVLKECYGYKIPSSAVRNIGGETGVFIRTGNIVKFKEINIIYTGKGFVIAEKNAENQSNVRQYDSVIVRGKDLYDGKIIQ